MIAKLTRIIATLEALPSSLPDSPAAIGPIIADLRSLRSELDGAAGEAEAFEEQLRGFLYYNWSSKRVSDLILARDARLLATRDRWIPVAEWPHVKSEYVWVWLTDGYSCEAQWFDSGGWYQVNGAVISSRVTHVMRKPPPPEPTNG